MLKNKYKNPVKINRKVHIFIRIKVIIVITRN
jgi:hypothetical protein